MNFSENIKQFTCELQADLFLAPQLDGAIKRFNVDMVIFNPGPTMVIHVHTLYVL